MGLKKTNRFGKNVPEPELQDSPLTRLDSVSLNEPYFRRNWLDACYGNFADGALTFVSKNRKSAALVIATLLVGIAPSLVHADILESKRGFADTGANYNDL